MKNTNVYPAPAELKINCHDPRHHPEFLLLSSSIHQWKDHVADRSWWLIQEKQCLAIFQRHGYDLQSGVWFCLIGIHRHGWAGVTNATLLFIEALNRKQRQCWPPLAASEPRRQIIEWYTTQVATMVFGLGLKSADANRLIQFEGAISIMLEHARTLNSRSQAALRNLSDYLHAGRLSLHSNVRIAQPPSPAPFPVGLVTHAPPELTFPLPSPPWRSWLAGSVTGIALTLTVIGTCHWLAHPSTAIRLNSIWPGNPLSSHWQKRVIENAATLPAMNSWQKVNDQLNQLEQRLLAAEQKRIPYLTISELKTAVYQLRQTLQQGGEPALAQLDQLQHKIENSLPISDVELDAVSHHLEALQSRLLYLISQR